MNTKKILASLFLLPLSLLASQNLVTIVENNSLLKIGKNNLYSDDGVYVNLYKGYSEKKFKDYSPYYFNNYEKNYDTSPTTMVMVGEKSIQYGSIFSRGFGIKYNINTLAALVEYKNFSIAIKSLDKFNKDDLIYVRTRLNHFTKEDFDPLVDYIENNMDENIGKRYLERMSYIFEIIEYGNEVHKLHSEQITESNTPVIKPVLFDYEKYMENVGSLTYQNSTANRYGGRVPQDSVSHPEYIMDGNIISRYCKTPTMTNSQDDEGYTTSNATYKIEKVGSIDIFKPIPLTDMYAFKYAGCAKIVGNYYNQKIVYPTIPSASNQKQTILRDMKKIRNGGEYLTRMKTFYSSLNSNSKISDNLKKLSERGITNGKFLHINYGIAEGIHEKKLVSTIIKNVTLGTMFNNKINLLTNEGLIYDINNAPGAFVDKTDSVSELSKEDVDGNMFPTLNYVVNLKIQTNVPEIDNFHKEALVVQGGNTFPISTYYGGEVLWVVDKNGNYISPFNYNNKNEILINSDDEFDDSKLIIAMKNYSRSQIANSSLKDSMYPLNLKGVTFKYIPQNTRGYSAKYFGPIFEGKTYLDVYTQKITDIIPINCSAEDCTSTEELMENPTREEIRFETKKYCAVEFLNPDTPKYKYFVFENIINRIVEEPFGDIQMHAHKTREFENMEIFNSNQDVPKVLKYVGEVISESDCLDKINYKMESTLSDELEANDIYNFDYNQAYDALSTSESGNYAIKSNKMTFMIDDFLMKKSILTKGIELTTPTILEGDVEYENFIGDSIFGYYSQLKELNINSSGKVDNIDTVIVFEDDFSLLVNSKEEE